MTDDDVTKPAALFPEFNSPEERWAWLEAEAEKHGLKKEPPDHPIDLEEERRERACHLSMEKERRVREMRFYDDLDGILDVVRELADLAEGCGAPTSEVDDFVDEIVRRLDRMPPPCEAQLRLELGRSGLAEGDAPANDTE